MGSTYLDLTNRVLSRLNEVPLDSDTFGTARGIHRTIRNTVQDVIQKINQAYFQWPWNAVSQQETLLVGVGEYLWPDDFNNVDWHSFNIDQDTTLGLNHEPLIFVDRNTWYSKYRELDQNQGIAGRNIPRYVFEGHGGGYGVSPSPNDTYLLTYRYYKNPALLTNFNDTTTIPSNFDYVVVDGVMYHLKLFKEDMEGAGFMKAEYENSLKEMRDVYSRKQDTLRDTRIRRW